MSPSVEKIETNKVKLTFHVGPEKFEEGLVYSYNKQKNSINLPGFRKGKVPRQIIEMQYGKEVFFPDAVEYVFNDAYVNALKELDIITVANPDADVVEVSKENGVIFSAEVYIKPEVTVANYKGITYPKYDITVTDENIEAEINVDRDKNARIITISDEPAELNDTVNINFEGFCDGVAFEGGKGDGYELTLGSHSFIDGFEDQIVGHSTGDAFDVNVVFPENYFSEDLKGKPALFKVELLEIKRKLLPTIDDDFAQDVSEFNTLDEYKNSISEKISLKKSDEAKRDKETKIMSKIIEELSGDIPEVMFETQTEQQFSDFKRNLQSQGMNMEMYLSYIGQTEQQLKQSIRPSAEAQIKGRLALEAIAKAENIEITDEDISTEIDRVAQLYKMDRALLEKSMSQAETSGITMDLKVQKALALIMDEAVCME